LIRKSLVVTEAYQPAQDLDPGPVDGGSGALPSAAPERHQSFAPRNVADRLREPCLADAGLARDQAHPAAPRAGLLQRPTELGKLPLAVHKRFTAACSGVKSSS